MDEIFHIIVFLQKIPLKIMGWGPKRRVFSFQKEKGVFIVENSSRATYFNLLFFGMMSVFIFSGLLILLILGEMNLGLAFMGFIIHPFFGIIGLRKFLWLRKGIETVRIEKGILTVDKTGTFWTKKRVYHLSKIKNVRSKWETRSFLSQPKEFSEILLGINELNKGFLCFTIGEIEFEYEGNKVRLFSDMIEKERQIVIENIKEFVEKPFQ